MRVGTTCVARVIVAAGEKTGIHLRNTAFPGWHFPAVKGPEVYLATESDTQVTQPWQPSECGVGDLRSVAVEDALRRGELLGRSQSCDPNAEQSPQVLDQSCERSDF